MCIYIYLMYGLGLRDLYVLGFPKTRGTFVGAPTTRIMVCEGLFWGRPPNPKPEKLPYFLQEVDIFPACCGFWLPEEDQESLTLGIWLRA